MKTETYANKLAALLGLPDHVAEVHAEKPKKNKTSEVAVDENEVQSFRAAQGIIYFLQAPELFTQKVCKHCGESFLVSRKFVGYCSYTCIRKSLEEVGVQWAKGDDLEALARDPQVYQGNEPIWIKNIDKLKHALEVLTEAVPASQA